MGQLHRVSARAAALLACTAALACATACSTRREPAPEETLRAESAAAAPRHTRNAPADVRFDAHGKLKASSRRIGWLELPSGFRERPGSTARAASFEADDMPLPKVRAYLDQRLIPEGVDYRANGMSYRNALPSHTQLAMPPVNVTVLETDRDRHTVRLLVDDLSPPAEKPLPFDVAVQEHARERSRAE